MGEKGEDGADEGAASRGESSDRGRGRGGRKAVFSRSNTEPIVVENEEAVHIQRQGAPSLSFSGPITASSNEGKSAGIRLCRVFMFLL